MHKKLMRPPSQRPSRTRILISKDIPHRLTSAELATLQKVCPGAEISEARDLVKESPADLAQLDVLFTEQQLPADLAAYPALRWVQLVSAGANQLTSHPLAETQIPVTTSSGLHGVPIAQFVTCTLLMQVHHLPHLGAVQASRQWPKDRASLRASLLRGQVAGIVGYGSIGRECARQLHCLGMRILALDPSSRRDDGYNAWPGTGDSEGTLPERWFKPSELQEMLPVCDVVVIAAPLTTHTAGMIGAKEIAQLKPRSRIIIISRGGIVDEPAMAKALKEGHLASAVIDCFVQEPPAANHFLYDTPNVIMTPHISAAFEGFWPAMISLFTENLRRFRLGQPLLNQANKRLGY